MSQKSKGIWTPSDFKWKWKEDGFTVVRSICWGGGNSCLGGCGVLLYVKDGKVVRVEGDSEFPWNQGRLCVKAFSIPKIMYHPDRLLHPLKRVGERGEGKWEKISWKEAFDAITTKVREIRDLYGARSLAVFAGTGRPIHLWVSRLIYSMGSPNWCSPGPSCYFPRVVADAYTLGANTMVDYARAYPDRYDNPDWRPPKCLIPWGQNTLIANTHHFGHWYIDLMRRFDTKLIVPDPKLTFLASKADLWLQLRPGTDGALALGMLNVTINQELYDKEFVEKWTYGFDKLKERVQDYPPEKVSEITWIPKEKIVKAAELFATSKPAAIEWGLPPDQNINSFPAEKAIECLRIITGNIDIPGTYLLYTGPAFGVMFGISPWGYFDLVPEERRKIAIGAERFPLTRRGFFEATPNDILIWDYALKEKPYPVKAVLNFAANPVANTSANARKVYDAIKKLDLFVATDLFMTPTAQLADYVLPCAAWPERDNVRAWWAPLITQNKAVECPGEAKADAEICLELGKRINPEAWPWNSVEEMLDVLVKPSGMTFSQIREKGWIYPPYEYKKYEKGLLRMDGKPGFATSSGKINIVSEDIEQLGVDSLPTYVEPFESPISTPQVYKEYPLVLATGIRRWSYKWSEGRQIDWMRELHPDPIVEIHPKTADSLGIIDGELVWVETIRGRCKQRAKIFSGIHPKVAIADNAWWFPEKAGPEPSLYGLWDSNINLCTDDEHFEPNVGSITHKGLLCKIYKVKEGE